MANKNGKPMGDGLNKSEAIREAMARNPEARPMEVVQLLAAGGVKVAPSLVYFIKSKAKQAKRKQKRDRMAAASAKTTYGNPLELVIRVKQLSREVGGVENL